MEGLPLSVNKIDCIGELCPIPLLRAVQELKKMNPKDILVLHCDHSCVAIDIEKWAKKKDYPIQCIELSAGEWEVYIEKPNEA